MPGEVASGMVAAVTAALLLQPTLAGAQDFRAQRLEGTTVPDLNGIWQALNTAHWNLEEHVARPGLVTVPGPDGDLPAVPVLALGAIAGVPGGLGVISDNGGVIPYQPWALERREENRANVLTRDPEVKCFLPGIPRATYMPYPFQIIQGTDSIVMAYEFASAGRIVYLEDAGPAPVPAWMGQSVGRWDGDTLMIEVTDQVADTWFDRAGNFHGEALKVTERFTLSGPDHLLYEATMEDPEVFTRPWTISMPLYRRMEPNVKLYDYKCVQFVEELLHGHLRRVPIVEHWEGDYGSRGAILQMDLTRFPSD